MSLWVNVWASGWKMGLRGFNCSEKETRLVRWASSWLSRNCRRSHTAQTGSICYEPNAKTSKGSKWQTSLLLCWPRYDGNYCLSPTSQNCHQHLKIVTNIFAHAHFVTNINLVALLHTSTFSFNKQFAFQNLLGWWHAENIEMGWRRCWKIWNFRRPNWWTRIRWWNATFPALRSFTWIEESTSKNSQIRWVI